jgi:hypothetical protein
MGRRSSPLGLGAKRAKKCPPVLQVDRGVNVGCQELIFSRYIDTNQTNVSIAQLRSTFTSVALTRQTFQ